MKHINLETFANGAFTAQVNRELESVTRNIQDPNTDARKPRKITVTVTIKPNEQRSFSTIGVEAKSVLAPALGAVTAMRMGRDVRTGEVEAVEIGTGQVPGQVSVHDIPGVVPEPKAYDSETGEILDEPPGKEPGKSSKLIDMRKQA